MKPEIILQSDMLDILFENRNKEYGAYALRKNYNKRLVQALSGTGLIVVLFIVLQSMKPKDDNPGELVYTGTVVNIEPDKTKPKEDPPKDKIKPAKPVPTIAVSAPVIKPNIVETTVPDIDSINGRVISNVTNNVASGIADPGPASTANNAGNTTQPTEESAIENNAPLNFAEVMPSFNGDIVKFMLLNLRQPDDIEEGQRIIVRVKFVVTADGNIDDAHIIQSGRTDLDQEVLRVVKKMPRWKPGMQAGRSVPVYFYLPVTFVSSGE